MLLNQPRVVWRARTARYQLTLDHYPHARQASLHFRACGELPLQRLRFTLHADGRAVHEIVPRQGARYRPGLLGRLRRLRLCLFAEYLIAHVLRRTVGFHLDLPPACLGHRQLTLTVENLGAIPVLISHLRLESSALAPGRSVPNVHPIEGYSDHISVAPGAPLQLFVHAPQRRFCLTVIRFGARTEILLALDDLPGKPQDYPADAYRRGAGWEPSFTLQVGANWRTGLYAARISDSAGAFDITFIVRKADAAAPARLAVLASTNTWQAYNPWGGASLYRYDLDDGLHKSNATLVHTQRPNPAAAIGGNDGHLANAEKHVLLWLEQNGIDYDLYADADLHHAPQLLAPCRALLLNTHSEYWTGAMYGALEHFLDRGGNLVYLSANGLYWKTALLGQQLEVCADNSNHSLIEEAGGRWRDYGRPEARVLGVRFTRAGYRSQFKPYRVLTPGHWVFAGTGVAKGDLIGAAGLNSGGASGWELDRIDPRQQPPGLVHLAKGTNRWGSGADMICYPHAGGGAVFSVGSITFGGSLAVDPVLSAMLRNVLTRFLGLAAEALERRAGI